MTIVPGTRGYENVIERFLACSRQLNFRDINQDFLQFLPSIGSRILDLGSGAGQNAAELARMGYSVVAVEPFIPFFESARTNYSSLDILWINDSLPLLEKLHNEKPFEFILLDAVWHHLDQTEREIFLSRLDPLMAENGICALSLRHGPAGAGKHVFAINDDKLCSIIHKFGFRKLLHLRNQSSFMKNKPNVSWSRIAFQKQ
ncbi:MAG: class I SAM-dependent methyltransferase [Cyanobacteria bacterium P01_F01_bin.143]